MKGIPEATVIILTTAERTELERLARSTKTERRLRQRAHCAFGGGGLGEPGDWAGRWLHDRHGIEVARALCRKADWRSRRNGRPGRRTKIHGGNGQTHSGAVGSAEAQGLRRWSGPLLAAALGDVDVQYIWRFLRAQKIDLAGRKSWCESSDPEFAAKAADVVGL
jgi:hypothetical protein